MTTILGVCGSLQSTSSNLALLRSISDTLTPHLTLFEGIASLPWFNPDDEPDPFVLAWRAALTSHDAVLIACPEYGHSLPGALKNAIDWVIGSGELSGKSVVITASTSSPERGLRGLAALATTLRAADARVLDVGPVVRGDDAMSLSLQATLREL